MQSHSIKWFFAGLLGLGLFLSGTPAGAINVKQTGCFTCHSQLDGALQAPTNLYPHDIHAEKGLGCHDCHGGNPNTDDHDKAKDSTFKGKPAKADIPHFCGKCHSDPAYMKQYNPTLPTDQEDKYFTSVHGQKLKTGDKKVATCINCHSLHDIRPPTEPKSSVYKVNVPSTCAKCHADAEYMKPYGIPTNQFSDYSKSVHGIALLKNKQLSAPACNDCHGNHAAAPPEAGKLGYVCGRCHVQNSQLFEASPHKKAFKEGGIPFCMACHGEHSIQPVHKEMVGTEKPAVCAECHDKGDKNKGYETAKFMRQNLDDLGEKYKHIQEIMHDSEQKGIDVEDLTLQARSVSQVLISSRTLVHSFDMAQFKKEISSGFDTVKDVEKSAQSLVDEFYYRQKGYGIATLSLTVFCFFLYLKIKRVDKEKGEPRPKGPNDH